MKDLRLTRLANAAVRLEVDATQHACAYASPCLSANAAAAARPRAPVLS